MLMLRTTCEGTLSASASACLSVSLLVSLPLSLCLSLYLSLPLLVSLSLSLSLSLSISHLALPHPISTCANHLELGPAYWTTHWTTHWTQKLLLTSTSVSTITLVPVDRASENYY